MDWPSCPEEASPSDQALFQAKLDDVRAARDHERSERAAMAARDWERLKITLTAEQDLRREVHETRLEVAKSALERSRAAAEFVRNASGALVTLYTGVIGATFAVTKHPLPTRGLVPAIFLAAAIVFSAGYVAFATRPRSTPDVVPTSELLERERRRLNAFTDWVNEIAMRRLYALQVSVLSVGFGAFTLPLPFLKVTNQTAWLVAAACAACALLVPAVTATNIQPENQRL